MDDERKQELLRQVIAMRNTEEKLEQFNETPVAERIRKLTEKNVAVLHDERVRNLIDQAQAMMAVFRQTVADLREQNENIKGLLEECVEFVVETSEKNGDTLPSCIEDALVFLTERALKRAGGASGSDPP